MHVEMDHVEEGLVVAVQNDTESFPRSRPHESYLQGATRRAMLGRPFTDSLDLPKNTRYAISCSSPGLAATYRTRSGRC